MRIKIRLNVLSWTTHEFGKLHLHATPCAVVYRNRINHKRVHTPRFSLCVIIKFYIHDCTVTCRKWNLISIWLFTGREIGQIFCVERHAEFKSPAVAAYTHPVSRSGWYILNVGTDRYKVRDLGGKKVGLILL